MKKLIHKNYIKSSNFIFISGILGLMNMIILNDELMSNNKNIIIAIFTILFVIGIGFMVRKGIEWMKYFLLFLSIVGLISIPIYLNNLTEKPIIGIINIAQTILQFWAMIILFQIPKETIEPQ